MNIRALVPSDGYDPEVEGVVVEHEDTQITILKPLRQKEGLYVVLPATLELETRTDGKIGVHLP